MDPIAVLQLGVLLAILVVSLHTNFRRLRRPTPQPREVLPLSIHTKIKTGQSAKITASPQRMPFQITRVFVASRNDVPASDWLINDIKVANRSQFSQSGDIPADMFATNAIDSFVTFEAVDTNAKIDVIVTYIGDCEEGADFFGAMIGEAEDPRKTAKRHRARSKAALKQSRNAEGWRPTAN
jgi:hypothetical protein